MKDEAPKTQALAGAVRTEESGYGRRLQDKLRRYGRHLSQELIGQIRYVYEAFCDPATPAAAKMIVAGALAYFLLPADALPDILPMLGFTDDAAVIGLALGKLREILRAHGGAERRAAAPTPDLEALQLKLAEAHRDLAQLEREAVKWRRVATAGITLTIILSVLYVLTLLSRSN